MLATGDQNQSLEWLDQIKLHPICNNIYLILLITF